MLLTAAERVLIQLLPLWNAKDAVRGATQEGIADGTGLRRSHVPRAVKRLLADGSVEVREGRLRGRGRKVRVYALTEAGIRRARDLVAGLESEEVHFGDRRISVAALALELRQSPAEIVAGLDDEGRYRPRQVALAVPETNLLEREAELRGLGEWLASAVPAVVVYGSRGMGKTALARAFVGGIRRAIVWVDVGPEAAARLQPPGPRRPRRWLGGFPRQRPSRERSSPCRGSHTRRSLGRLMRATPQGHGVPPPARAGSSPGPPARPGGDGTGPRRPGPPRFPPATVATRAPRPRQKCADRRSGLPPTRVPRRGPAHDGCPPPSTRTRGPSGPGRGVAPPAPRRTRPRGAASRPGAHGFDAIRSRPQSPLGSPLARRPSRSTAAGAGSGLAPRP